MFKCSAYILNMCTSVIPHFPVCHVLMPGMHGRSFDAHILAIPRVKSEDPYVDI